MDVMENAMFELTPHITVIKEDDVCSAYKWISKVEIYYHRTINKYDKKMSENPWYVQNLSSISLNSLYLTILEIIGR